MIDFYTDGFVLNNLIERLHHCIELQCVGCFTALIVAPLEQIDVMKQAACQKQVAKL